MSLSSLPLEIVHKEILCYLSSIQCLVIKNLLYRVPYPSTFNATIHESIVEEGIPLIKYFWNKMDKTSLPYYVLRKGNLEALKYLEFRGYIFNEFDQLLEAVEYGNEPLVMCFYNKDIPIPWNRKCVPMLVKAINLTFSRN